MKNILEELKGSMKGIIGSFVVDADGKIAAEDMPDLMSGKIDTVSMTLHHVTDVIKATRSFDKITVDSDSAKLIAIPANDRILVVAAEKNLNLPLFKLMSNMATSKLKDAPASPVKPKEPAFDSSKVCDVYDLLYGAVAKRLANIIGPKSAVHFREGADAVIKSYPGIYNGLGFASSGKPDMESIKAHAKAVSNKEELLDALDEMLLAMLDSVKKVAGAKQEQKAMDEVQQIKSQHFEIQ